MYLEYAADGHFEAATGTLVENDGVVRYESCMWIEDTRDGGASRFITHIDDVMLKRWSRSPGTSEEVPFEWENSGAFMTTPTSATGKTKQIEEAEVQENDEKRRIHATCHCGGVQFYISPPDAGSKLAASPYPDLIVPYHRGSDAATNPKNDSWWIVGDEKFLAGTCACTTCRRASGFDITFWGFIPTSNITLDAAGKDPFARNEGEYWGTMKSYRSSANVTRTFCGRCGANVFWDGDERPSIVDVAVGLLNAKSGAKAEELLAWWPTRVSFEEDGLNKGLIRGLEDGLKEWSEVNKGKRCVATRED
jgi:hypothetical protein